MKVIYPNPNKKMELVVTWPVDILSELMVSRNVTF